MSILKTPALHVQNISGMYRGVRVTIISMSTGKLPVTYADFDKLDLRAGTVVEVTTPDWSKKLLRFVVDFGQELGKRVIFSGIQKWYQSEEFIGKQFTFLTNLQPKKMGEEESQGMMLMADIVDGNPGDLQKPTLIPLQNMVENGTVIR